MSVRGFFFRMCRVLSAEWYGVVRQDKAGRVGEKATPAGATHSPLVEPDVRMSRIRLSWKHQAEGMHRFPIASAKRVSQQLQPQALEMGVEAHPFRRAEGPLTAAFQVLLETLAHVVVDLPVSRPGIPKRKVVRPAF